MSGDQSSAKRAGAVPIPDPRSAPPAENPAGWLCTGLQWIDGRPNLVAVDGGRERLRVLVPGERLRLRWSGTRRCVGWSAPKTGRTPCPDAAEISESATLAQCVFCQSRDHGLAIARDRITDDGRTYQLYLAWFAPGMLKVGITAEQRGTARLLEQGAIGYTVIATGSLPAARRAELTLSGTGLARERYRASAKVEAWWQLPEAAGLRAGLENGRAKALRILADHDLGTVPDGAIVDNHAFFGLGEGAPAAYREIDALEESGSIDAVARSVIGKHVFLTETGSDDEGSGGGSGGGSASRPMLLDLRLLAGRPITAVDTTGPRDAGACTGLRLVERRRPVQYDMDSLF